MRATIKKFRTAQLSSSAKEKGISTLLILLLVLSISGVFTLGEAFSAQGLTFNSQPTSESSESSEAALDDPSQGGIREIEESNDCFVEIANASAEDTDEENNDYPTEIVADEVASINSEDATGENLAALLARGGGGPAIGFPMYSWGNNAAGHLGLGDTTSRTTPQPVPGGSKWVTSVTAAGGSFAISIDGYLYGWGAARNAYHMGQGGIYAHLPEILTTPTRIGNANNWVYVSARGSITSVGAVNSAGELWTWGNNNRGQLGHGDATSRNAPVQVGTRTDWASVTVGGNSTGEDNHMMLGVLQNGQAWSWGRGAGTAPLIGRPDTNAQTPQPIPDLEGHQIVSVALGGRVAAVVTANGQLFTWGVNTYSQLGRTVNAANPANRPRQAGAAINWQEVRVTNRAAAALCTAGRLFTWGTNNGGELGNGSSAGSTNTITQVGTREDWVSIHGGNSHFLAFSGTGWLYAWGNNGSGQLGVGGNDNRNVPTRVAETQNFTTAARGGGTHSIMLIHIEPIAADEFLMEKILKMPAGTSSPDLEFTFNMNRRSFNDLTTPAALANFPSYDTTRYVVINDSSDVVGDPGDPIARLRGMTDILGNVGLFSHAGVYAWTISEEPYLSGATPPSQVFYSQVEYKFVVVVGQEPGIGGDFYIDDVRVYRTADEEGDVIYPPHPIVPPRIAFENIYKRTTTGSPACPGALFISKTVEGPPADPATVFNFDITLRATALCVAPEGTTFTGRVYAGDTFVRYEGPFTSGTVRTVPLLDGQRIVFPTLVVGTQFDVEEQAIDDFIAEVLLYVNGEPTTLYNLDVNLPLSVEGPHRIEDVSRNSADFTNEHDFIPIPMGLSLSNNSWVVAVMAVGLLFTLLVLRNVRRREKSRDIYPFFNLT